MKFTKDNYINIQGWMITELGLSGNELILYALIYGFSQDGESVFSSGQKYLASALNVSVDTVQNLLKKLIEKELILKIDATYNNVKFYHYKTNLRDDRETKGGGGKSRQRVGEKVGINNKLYNKEDIIHSEAKASSFIIPKKSENKNASSSPLEAETKSLDFNKELEAIKHTCSKEEWERIKPSNSTLSKTETVQLPPYVDPNIWDDWVKHRKEIKHPLTPISIRKQIKQLEEWHDKGLDVNEIIEICTANGYQGLFANRQAGKPDDNDGWSFKPYKEGWSW
jgi:DNA-binding Lrp family transcriptional regulator